MSPFRTLVPAVVAIAALTAACSSSTSGSGTSAAPSAATLRSVNVKQGDLPSGWSGKASTTDNSKDKNVSKQIAACTGVGGSGEKGQLKVVDSDDFSMGQSTVSSSATSYRTAGDVQDQVDLLKNPKTEGCLNSIFKKTVTSELPSSATVGALSLHLDTSSSKVRSNVVGTATVSVSVTVAGRSIKVYLIEEFVTGSQLTSSISFTTVGSPPSSSLVDSVTKAVATRAANA